MRWTWEDRLWLARVLSVYNELLSCDLVPAEYLPNRLMSKFGRSPILSRMSTEWRVRGYLSYTATSNPVVRSCSGLREGKKRKKMTGINLARGATGSISPF